MLLLYGALCTLLRTDSLCSPALVSLALQKLCTNTSNHTQVTCRILAQEITAPLGSSCSAHFSFQALFLP